MTHDTDLLLVAEKLGSALDRLDRLESELTAQALPIQAAGSAQDAALRSLEAALAGIKALNQHVLGNDLGALSSRVDEAGKQFHAALAGIENKVGGVSAAFSAQVAELRNELGAMDATRRELSAVKDASAERFNELSSGFSAEVKSLREELAARVSEFATPKGIEPAGEWVNGALYGRLSAVTLNGSSYLSLVDLNGEKPSAKSSKWQVLARRGAGGAGGAGGGATTWDGLQGKPTVIAAGATQAEARGVIDAMGLSAEAADYASRISTAGGTISAADISIVDEFVATGKRDAWFSALRHCNLHLGDNLAAALVNLVYTPAGGGTSSITTVGSGWDESNYNPILGINAGAESQSTRYLTTGYSPSADGLSAANMGYACVTLSDKTGIFNGNFGRPFALVTGGASDLYFIEGNVISGIAAAGASVVGEVSSAAGAHIKIVTNSSSLGLWMDNGVTTVSHAGGGTASIAGTWMLFRRSGSPWVGTADVGFTAVFTGLTAAQARSLNGAIERALIRKGRMRATFKPSLLIIGDSISAGQIVTYTSSNRQTGRWTRVLAECLPAHELCHGVPSAQLRQAVGSLAPLSTRFSDVVAQDRKPDICVIALGVNDMNNADGNANGDPTIIADYTTKLTTAINALKAAGIRVVVASTSYTTASNDTKCRAYVAAAASAASSASVPFADCYDPFIDTATPGSAMSDSVHPNDIGHAYIARAVQAALRGDLIRSPLLDFPNVAAGGTQTLTFDVYTATAGMRAQVTPPTSLESGLIVEKAGISSAGVGSITVRNVTGSDINPAPARWGFVARATI